jgi:hypothetical protein
MRTIEEPPRMRVYGVTHHLAAPRPARALERAAQRVWIWRRTGLCGEKDFCEAHGEARVLHLVLAGEACGRDEPSVAHEQGGEARPV